MTTRQFSVLGLFFGALFLSACHATGPTFTVDTTSDTVDVNPGDGLCADSAGDCSLRAAIQESNVLPEVQTVALTDGLTYTLSITGTGENLGATGDLDITQGVVISGNATIDADGIDRVVEMRNSSGLVELIGVNLVGGQATNGAAFVANGAGLVSVLEAAIHDNTATSGSPVAINRGSAFLWDSVVYANAGTTASGVTISGGNLSLENTTLSNNSGGRALSSSGGATTVAHSTITANNNGGIRVVGGSINVRASVVAGQAGGADCSGSVTSSGHNLEGSTSCGFSAPGDIQNTAAALGPLADNGGPTLTHAPLAGSPLIDAATAASCTSFAADARGFARPTGIACDIGAVEVQGAVDCSPSAIGPGRDLSYCDLSGLSLAARNLSGANLTGADLSDALLPGANLQNTILNGARLDRATMNDASIAGASATGTTFEGSILQRTNVTAAQLSGADLYGVVATGITTTPASLPPGWLQVSGRFVGAGVDLTGVDLSGIDLTGVDFTDTLLADLSIVGATITGANFAAATFEGLLTSGLVGAPAALPPDVTLSGGYFIGPGVIIDSLDLVGSNFSGRNFTGTEFRNLSLNNTDFTGANLTDVVFDSVTLGGADLTGADTTGVFSIQTFGTLAAPSDYKLDQGRLWAPGVDLSVRGPATIDLFSLTGVDISGAVLDGLLLFVVDFHDVNARGLSLRGARTPDTTWHDSDLTGADFTDSRIYYQSGFADSDLTNVDFTGVSFDSVNISRSTIEGAIFADVSFVKSSGYLNTGTPAVLDPSLGYSGGFLFGTNGKWAIGATIPGEVFSNTYLPAELSATATDTVWSDSDLQSIRGDFSGASFTNTRIGQVSNATIANADFSDVDFRDMLSYALTGTPAAIPEYVLYRGGSFMHPWGGGNWFFNLSGQDLSGADLTGSDYSGRSNDLQQTNLSNVSLVGADLRGADLRDTNLSGANLAGAQIDGTRFGTNVAGATVWNNTICPDGTNTNTNGGTCVGHDRINRQSIVIDPTGTATVLSTHTITLGQPLIVPTLTFVSGATVTEGSGAGVDWYIDGVLFRDDDILAPFQTAGNGSLPTGTDFPGRAGGAGNTFNIGVGIHTLRAEASTTAGPLSYTATFRVDEP